MGNLDQRRIGLRRKLQAIHPWENYGKTKGEMMQVMSKEEAAKRGLFTRDPVTGKPVPFITQRIEMTPEQRAQHYEDLAAGKIPF